MNDDNDNNRSVPAGPADTPEWVPTPDQPWRPIPDGEDGDPYQYDEGAPWCVDRASHPQFHRGYPSLNHHRTECRSYDGFFGALDDDGRPGYFSAYLVRPFRFGQLGHTADQTRLAVEFEPADDGGQPFRCTIHATMLRNLAAYLAHRRRGGGVATGPAGQARRCLIGRNPARCTWTTGACSPTGKPRWSGCC